jgi:hypothetical protein
MTRARPFVQTPLEPPILPGSKEPDGLASRKMFTIPEFVV